MKKSTVKSNTKSVGNKKNSPSKKTSPVKKTLNKTSQQNKLIDDIISTMDGGIALWDSEDRLVTYNSEFRKILASFPDFTIGNTFLDHLTELAQTGIISECVGSEIAWAEEKNAERLAELGQLISYQTHDGSWISRIDHRLAGGGIISIRKDITVEKEKSIALKNNSFDLELASTALEQFTSAVLIKDAKCQFRLVNSAFCKILGKQASEIIGKTTTQVHGKIEAEAFDVREKQVLDTGEIVEFDELLHDFEGTPIHTRTQVRPIKSKEGEDFVCIVINDISDIKQREIDLKQANDEIELNRQRLKAFAETSADWFWECDADLKYTYFSKGLTSATGLQPSDLIGKVRSDLWKKESIDEDAKSHLADLKAHKSFKDFTYPITNQKTGDKLWIAVSGSPNFDGDGKFVGYIGSGRNVNDNKNSELALVSAHKELANSKNRIQAFAETSADWFWEMDSNLRFSYFSESFEKVSGVAPDALLGKTRKETGIPGISDEEFQAHLELLDNRQSFRDFIHSRVLKDNTTIWLSISGNPTFDINGEFQGYQGSGRDVTEQVNRQSELEKAKVAALNADRAKSEFLANMSHEIRTPMNGVMGMAELLTKTELDAKQKMFTDVIVKSGNSLLTIINDILDFSKLDAGQMELDPAPFKLAEAIEDVATLVSSRVAEKDLELIVRIDPSLPEIMIGDVGRIRQIVTNLMGNAVKFTEHGHVYVNVTDVTGQGMESQNKAIRFEIEDTGIGIPKEQCAAVFEKFSQVDASSSRKHEGTGLGLAIASSLIEIMHGEYGVESAEGEGSTFWFEIELEADETHVTVKPTPSDMTGARILIVDDNAVNRAILSEQMQSWNFDSAAAVDGYEALAILRAAHEQNISIDCVILDYHMPGLNGGDVAAEMRSDPALSEVPIIMLTSVDQTEDGKVFSSLGIQGHLTKPARSSHLLETIVQILQSATPGKPNVEFQKPALNTQTEPTQIETYEPTKGTEKEANMKFDNPLKKSSSIDVLVCEDNEVNQIVFTQILQNAGYTFEIADNGKIGVEKMQTYKPKVILMDVSMPEMNGLDATQAIRKLEKASNSHTPIIGVTAHAIKGDMEKCIESGMDDYLSKPVSPDRLQEKISNWLDSVNAISVG